MSEIFKKLLLKKEIPFLSKIVHFRHKMAWISEKKAHSQKSQDTCLIICDKEVNRGPAPLIISLWVYKSKKLVMVKFYLFFNILMFYATFIWSKNVEY